MGECEENTLARGTGECRLLDALGETLFVFVVRFSYSSKIHRHHRFPIADVEPRADQHRRRPREVASAAAPSR